MHDALRNDLYLLQQRIHALHDASTDHDAVQTWLGFAACDLERALDLVGGAPDRPMHAGDSLDGIASGLAELHIRLDTRRDGSDDDPRTRMRLALANHLLEHACTLLAHP
jgi:hypothetical protein